MLSYLDILCNNFRETMLRWKYWHDIQLLYTMGSFPAATGYQLQVNRWRWIH